MTDDEFLARFEAAEFTRKDWTHEAHVRMAWLYLTRVPFGESLEKVRGGIQKLNAAIGPRPVPQWSCMRPRTGYHETITVAFVRVIASRLGEDEGYEEFRDRNPDLYDRELPALLRHYSKSLLFSTRARSHFIEPDREPLPLPST